MVAQITLRVITPDRIAMDTTVDSVRIPGLDGSMGILPGHARMVAALDSGELRFKASSGDERLFVSGGFAEVRDNTVRVVTDAGERPKDIDPARAAEAERRARERISAAAHGDRAIDVLRAEQALRRALMRKLLSER